MSYANYYTITSTTASTSNYVYTNFIQETYDTKHYPCPDIDIFPFKVEHEIVETKGNRGYHTIQHRYSVKNGYKYIDNFYKDEEVSIEYLEERLSKEGQKWLDKEMRSTMKVD